MKIVFLDEYSLCGRDLSRIKALGDYVGYETTSADEVLERCNGAGVVISNKVCISREVMAQCPELKLIAVAATGMNNVDLEAARELGIEVRNAVGYSTHSVAEATLSAALSLFRGTVHYDRFIKSGGYARSTRIFCIDRPVRQLFGKRWGVIGLGNIGREVARLAEAFGCEVAYHSTSGVAREERFVRMPLDELLAWADVVSVHAPLNDATRNLIGAGQLAAMKRDAIIINVARGGIVDEAALADALNGGVIAGAALDVFSQEPLPHSPLYSLKEPDSLLASPHTAWAAAEAIDILIGCIADNISTYISHK